MAQVKNLHLNDDVALANHSHSASDISTSESGVSVQDKLNSLTNGKVSTIQSDDSINVDTASQGTSATQPKLSVNISAEAGNGLQLSSTSNKGLYVSKETLGLSSAYIPQGNIDISGAQGSTPAEKQKAAAKALLDDTTNVQPGYVYNIPYDGTIAESSDTGAPEITVKVGDNIVVIDSNGTRKWDKLSATIDVPVYTGGDGITINSSTHVVSVDPSDGITLDNNGVAVKLSTTNPGLKLAGSTAGSKTLEVDPGDGIALNGNGVNVNLSTTNPGLKLAGSTAGSKTLEVDPGDGITLDSNGVAVKLSTNNPPGLALTGTAGSKTLEVDPSDGITLDSNGVAVKLTAADPGLELAGTAGTKTLQVLLNSSNPGLSKSGGLHVVAGGGIATSGDKVQLNRRTATSGQTVTQASGLDVDDSGTVAVKVGNGIEIDGSNVVGVDISETEGRKNINNDNGTYVSLNRAYNIKGTAKLDDANHNPTIGSILSALGASMSS
jgi:hypothetical protein